MKTYKITFHGKKPGSIGRTYHIEEVVTAKDPEHALSNLHARGFEHISSPVFEIVV